MKLKPRNDKYYVTKLTTAEDAETTILVGKPPKNTVKLRFKKQPVERISTNKIWEITKLIWLKLTTKRR